MRDRGREMRKSLVALVLILGVGSAHAAYVEVAMHGEVGSLGTGALEDVILGSAFTTSFMLDTSVFDSADLSFTTIESPFWEPGQPVLDRFFVQGALYTGINTVLGDHSFVSKTGSGSYGGALSSPFNSDDYDLSMHLSTQVLSLTFQDFSSSRVGGFLYTDLQADPLTTIALGFDRPPAFSYLNGAFGTYGITMHSVSVRQVPEPGTLLMLVFGVIASGAMAGSRSWGKSRSRRSAEGRAGV